MTTIALAALVHPTGTHVTSWLHPGPQAHASTDIDYYRRMAQFAERGMFDLFLTADALAARMMNLPPHARFPMFMSVFDPATLLAAVAGATTHIGLGGTMSTSFFEPHTIARQFASLDHISHGRAAWNVVTSAHDFAARNFGLDTLPPHADRYARSRELVKVVQQLLVRGEDGAFIRDREQGLHFDPTKQHSVAHGGADFHVTGALNIERTPQGQPVIIQAGTSKTERDFAAETAGSVFASDSTI